VVQIFETRKAPGALTPPLFSPSSGSKNILRARKIQAQVVQIFEAGDLSYLLRVCYDYINQDITCLFFWVNNPVLAYVTKSVTKYFCHSVAQSDPNGYCAIKMQMNASLIPWLSKLASTFILALIE